MIGMFTSTVPVRFKLDTGLKIEDLINLVNRELKLGFLNQKYPYDLLIKDLELGKKGYDGLFKMCVNYYNSIISLILLKQSVIIGCRNLSDKNSQGGKRVLCINK